MHRKFTPKQLGIGALLILGALMAVILLGFGAKAAVHEITKERPHFSTGIVVDKDFNPAHYDDYTTQQYVGETCYGTGTNRNCQSNYITIYHHDYVPDDWNVRIENCNVYHKDGRLWVDKHGKAKCFKKWIDVDQSTYNSYRIGAKYA